MEAREAAWAKWWESQPFKGWKPSEWRSPFDFGWKASAQHYERLIPYAHHTYRCAVSPRRSFWDKRPRECTCGLEALEDEMLADAR